MTFFVLCTITQKCSFSLFFFFQAEDGIRDADVTGVQTCALPIYGESAALEHGMQMAVGRTEVSLFELDDAVGVGHGSSPDEVWLARGVWLRLLGCLDV